MLNKTKNTLVFTILITFLWTQFIWAYGIPLQNEAPTKPEERQKNLSNNIQYTFPKDSCKFSKTAQILNRINSGNYSPNIIENNPFPSVKEPTAQILKVAFLRNPAPQIPPQFYPSCGVSTDRGHILEIKGTIDGKSYNQKATQIDDQGRVTAYQEKHKGATIIHSNLKYDDQDRIIAERVTTKTSKGSWVFKTKSKTVVDYTYSYTEDGTRKTETEHKISSKVSSNPLGKLVQTVATIAIACIPGLQPIAVAALTAAASFGFGILSGASPKDALIGAAISFGAYMLGSAVGGYLSGGQQGITQVFSGATGPSFTQNLTNMFTGFVKQEGRS